MSELTTQKLLLTMACVLGVVLVLISLGRHKNGGFERSSYPPKSISAGKPAEIQPPAPSPRQTPSAKKQAWYSTPTPTQPNRQAKYATRQLPKRASSRTNPTVVENYFDSTPLQSKKPSHRNPSPQITQHPLAQRYAQKNPQRNPTPQIKNQTWPTFQAEKTNPFINDGYVQQAAATTPVSNGVSSVRRADFESLAPKPDISTRRQHNHSGASRLSLNQGITTTRQEIASYPVTAEPSVSSSKSALTLEHEPVESTPIRIDKRVRKANWAEIEPATIPDIKTIHRPLLQQLNLPKQRPTPQVEEKAREQVQYGQSLARRQAFFASREELIRALLLITSSYRTEGSSNAYPQCLARALVALDEISDLMNMGDTNSPQLQQTLFSHQTRILTPQDIQSITPMQAIGAYSSFAQAQIEKAIGTSAAGSEALHALGRLESIVPETSLSQARTKQTKTLVLYRAAINIDPSNTTCANDLGVLLYKIGRLQEAEHALKTSLGSAQTPLTWNNLASVHNQLAATASTNEERNRQLSLASSAAQQAERFTDAALNDQPSDGQWATATEFQDNAAFPNVVLQNASPRPASTSTPQPGASNSAKLKQKLKEWF